MSDPTADEKAQELYDTLKEAAMAEARQFILRQAPAELSDKMTELADGDFPVPKVEQKLPYGTPKSAIGQYAAQKAAAAAAEGKVSEVEGMVEEAPPPPAPPPTQVGGSAPPTTPPPALDQPPA